MQNNDRKKIIQQGFDTISAGYDHPSLSFFPETAKRLVKYLKLEQLNQVPGQQLLDVCTGTGVVALAAAEKLSRGKIIGIDLSSGMLQQAKNKAIEKNLNNIEFQQMDLENLSFPQESFDIATSSFGLFFLEDMTKGLNNIANTVRKGGKIAITTFTGKAFSPMAEVFVENYKATGRDMSPPSWKRLTTEELVREQFKAVNITDVSIYHEPLGYQMTSPQMWWDVVWNAGWRIFIDQMTEEEQKVFKEAHLREISKIVGKEGIWFNTEVMVAVGKKAPWA